jgi:hypothetical protein
METKDFTRETSILLAIAALAFGCVTTIPGADGVGEGCGECEASEICSAVGECIPADSCLVDEDCGGGALCEIEAGIDSDLGTCKTSSECAHFEIQSTLVKPNVLIVLDRSGSMEQNAGGKSRWNAAKQAIATVTQSYDDGIRFGLSTYSSCMAGGCSAGSIVTPIADNNASTINGFLANKVDQGSVDGKAATGGNVKYLCDSDNDETSTGRSLEALVGEPSIQDPERPNAILLITDGEESNSCIQDGMDGPSGASELLDQSIAVRTYVVGLGINSASVNAIAASGGTASAIPRSHSRRSAGRCGPTQRLLQR